MHASRIQCCRTVSLVSSPQTQTTRPRRASRSTSSPQSAWACLPRACANGSRMQPQSPNRYLSQRATATTQGVCRATRATPHAATHARAAAAEAGAAPQHGDAGTRDHALNQAREGEATREVPRQTASTPPPAKHAQGLTLTRAPALAPTRLHPARSVTTPPAAPRAARAPRLNAVVAARQNHCHEAHRREGGVGVRVRV